MRCAEPEVDAEGLLRKEVLACLQHVQVDRLVQVVRHRDIHHVHLRIRQQLMIIRRDLLTARDAAEPLAHGLDQVGHGHQFRLHIHID
jgi:hypothetical protein